MANNTSARKVNEIRFEAYTNGSYHADREAVLDRRHRWMMFLVIALGASAVLQPLGDRAASIAAFATAIIGAMDLAFGFSVRARNHAFLRKEYFRIASELVAEEITTDAARAKLTALAGEEEPPYRAAHAIAENWATRAVFGDALPLPCRVTWLQRRFRHWLLMTSIDFSAKHES